MPLRLFTAGITIVRLRWLIRYSRDSYDGKLQSLAGEGRSGKRYQFKLRTGVNVSVSNMTQ